MSVTVEPPTTLHVIENLSVSSINTFLRCPERWRRRYVEREYELPSGQMILGSSAGAAIGRHYQEVVDTGEGLSTPDVLDCFSDEWNDRTTREEIDWGRSQPETLRDSGGAAVTTYHRTVAPTVVPTTVERQFSLSFDGVDWGLTGFLDFEEADGSVADLKMKGRKFSDAEAKVDLQPTAYLLARRAEGNPAPAFHYHTMVRTKVPQAIVVPTIRTDSQLDHFVGRIFTVAREIAWRLEHDVWQGAVPGSWYCSERFCGHWDSCPMGGAQ